MFDIYLVIIPIIGVLTCVTLIVFKFSLAEPKLIDLQKYQLNPQLKQYQSTKSINKNKNHLAKPQNDTKQQTGFKKTFKYLLKNFTLVEFCFIRRSRNKIPLLLQTSSIALLTFLIPIPFAFSIIGGIVTIIFALGKMLSNRKTSQQQTNNPQSNYIQEVKKQEKNQHKLQMVFTFFTLGLNLFLIGLLYKNYRNTLLLERAQNCLVNLALNNVIIKPLLLLIFALPIQNLEFVNIFIDKQSQIVQIIHEIRIIKSQIAHISAKSPRKKHSSPSKVPRATLQVQPRIKDGQKYLSTLDLNKNLRKSKLSPLSLRKKNNQNQEANSSLMSILNSNQKNKKHKQLNESMERQKRNQQDQTMKRINLDLLQASKYDSRRRNKLYTSKTVLVNAENSIINGLDVQNQEDDQRSNIYNRLEKSQKSLKQSDYRTSKNGDNLKVNLNKDFESQIKLSQGLDEQDQSSINQFTLIKPTNTFQEDNSVIGANSIQSSRKLGLLKIHQDKNGQDLEQIDLNSPQRRKRQGKNIEQEQIQKNKKKKSHKKHSLDPNRYVIKHTTGQPYLEFLPNLLNKQRQQKKKKSQYQFSQQQFSRKMDLLQNDSRFSKSVKRTKNNKDPIVRQNDQNRVPQFIIQDFES